MAITGMVLCGGQSVRMGTDKGLLKQDEKSWVEAALAMLQRQSLDHCLVSVNPGQIQAYASIIPRAILVPDHESLAVKGPLLGLLSGHLLYSQSDFLLLACDMPQMQDIILARLMEAFREHPGFDGYIYLNDGEAEPLCAIYTASGLAKIYDLLQKGALQKHSMKYAISQLSIWPLPLTLDDKKYFLNMNTPHDLHSH